MNNNYQAKNGFKTFIITLSISIFVFSSLYYLVSGNLDSGTTSIDQTNEVKGTSDQTVFSEISKRSEEDSQDLRATSNTGRVGNVLSGSDVAETTQTTVATVPDTGSNGIMVAFVIAASSLALGLYIFFVGPRNFALIGFERKTIKELEQ